MKRGRHSSMWAPWREWAALAYIVGILLGMGLIGQVIGPSMTSDVRSMVGR